MRLAVSMAEQVFLELSAEEQRDILQTVAPQLARSASKDFRLHWKTDFFAAARSAIKSLDISPR